MNKKNEISMMILFWEFFKIGLFTVGGGLAMISVIEKLAVEKKKWLTADEMIDCIALSQAVPGIIAINVATFIGYKKRGIRGGIVATLGAIMPSFVIILMLSNTIRAFSTNKFVIGAMMGIKGALIGLLMSVIYSLGKTILKDYFQYVIALCTVIFITFFKFSAIKVMIVSGVCGILYLGAIRIWKEKKSDE